MTKLIATRDFKYRTRRLLAGDEFDARSPLDAKILTDVRRVAAVPLPEVTKPVIPTVDEVLTAEVVETPPEPEPAPEPKKAPAKRSTRKKAAAKK